MNFLDPFNPEFWLRVGASLAAGAIIGIERQLRGKPCGIRTATLICLSTQLFVSVGMSSAVHPVDPMRFVASVVTGIGFLGGGVIIGREGIVTGVTTAAVIWILAAIGVLIGTAHVATGIAMAGVTVAVLIGVDSLETRFGRFRRGDHARNGGESS